MATYITPDELRQFVNDGSQLLQGSFEDAVESASREVEELCGTGETPRSFFAATSASARTFYPYNNAECCVDDISSTSGLLVAIDSDGNGTYDQSWTISTDFFLEPVNAAASGKPYTKLTATLQSKYFILKSWQYQRPTVQVTAKWGWPAIPSQVKQATKILGARALALGSAPLDLYGGNEYGQARVPMPNSATRLLAPFMQSQYAVA